MNNISTFDDLWPQRGEKIRYYFNDTRPYLPFEPTLTCGNEYSVENIQFTPVGPVVEIRDDNERPQNVFLYKFKFLDEYQREDN